MKKTTKEDQKVEGGEMASKGLYDALHGIILMLEADGLPTNRAMVIGNLTLLGNSVLNKILEEDD